MYIKFLNNFAKVEKKIIRPIKKQFFYIFANSKIKKNNWMKGYIGNLNGLHFKYIIINFILALAGFLTTFFVGKIIFNYKINMYLSVVMMMIILVFFLMGKKKYLSQLLKIKDFPLGKRLNSHHLLNKKRLNSFTFMNAFAILFLILSNNYLYLFFSFLFLVLILLNRSSKFKLKIELNLSEEEVESLSQPIIEKGKKIK